LLEPALPTAPLVAFITGLLERNGAEDIRATIGVPATTLRRHLEQGSLSIYLIDRYCCALGYHPSYVYKEAWWEAISQEDDQQQTPGDDFA